MDGELVVLVSGTVVSIPLMCRGAWYFLHVDPKLKQRGRLFLGAGAAAQVVMCVVLDFDLMAAVNAMTFAWNMHDWWNNGGGDGMKRRLGKLSAYLGFGPQTAPVGG